MIGISKFLAVYRAWVPERIRTSAGAKKAKQMLLKLKSHDNIYNRGYYEEVVDSAAVRSAPDIADSIVQSFNPKSVIDIGCGTGALLEALKQRGCEVFGLDYSSVALEFCRNRGIRVGKFDLEKDSLELKEKFDVAVSIEVAEHLPKRVADKYVELLARSAEAVVFTAAPPGQGGTDHVNEQPPSYWINKFRGYGLELNEVLTAQWKRTWQENGKVENFYFENLLVFSSAQTK